LPADRVAWWRERMTHFPEKRAVLLPLLHDVQDHAGCLTRDGMRWVAELTGITPVEVWGVATFYWMYDFEPRARWRIAVCHNISCDLRGKDAIVQAIRDELGIEAGGKTSADGCWSLCTVECMGACTAAPMMDVNGRYYEELTPEKTRQILQRIREGNEPLPDTPVRLSEQPAVARSYAQAEAGR
jgi:NADH-quinone oxidoreductase E subunit